MIYNILSLNILLVMAFATLNMEAQNIEIIIQGIRNTNGNIELGVFKDNDGFQAEKSFLDKKFSKTGIINGEMRVQFRLDAGIWGLSLLDDENNNEKMDYKFPGIPKEGFGFSDYFHTGFSKPKFDSFKFSIVKYQTKRLTIRVRYF